MCVYLPPLSLSPPPLSQFQLTQILEAPDVAHEEACQGASTGDPYHTDSSYEGSHDKSPCMWE